MAVYQAMNVLTEPPLSGASPLPHLITSSLQLLITSNLQLRAKATAFSN